MTLQKLTAIRGDLVCTDPGWESWDFVALSKVVRQWVKRNPALSEKHTRKNLFNAWRDVNLLG